MCFITPKRVRSGNRSTMSVVVRDPARRRSRIALRVSSASAFQIGSRLLGIGTTDPAYAAPGRSYAQRRGPYARSFAGTFDGVQKVLPALAGALARLVLDEAEGTMPQCQPGAASNLRQADLHVSRGRIRHKEGAGQFEQRRRLENLNEPPQVPGPRTQVPEPPP